MNGATSEDAQRLKQMLEEATAADASVAGHATPAAGNAESAALREAWLAFGQLIRAADAALPAMPNLAAAVAARKPRRGRLFGLMAAAAAALLVAVACGWWIGRDSKQGNRQPSLAQTATAEQARQKTAPPPRVKQEQPKTAVARAEQAMKKQPNAGTAKTSTWDDPLETQIASVSQQIRNVEQNWQHRVDDVDLVQYRIDEVADALQNDPL